MHPDLTPDHDAFVQHCHHLLDNGCTGVAMLGTTGEANSFSGAERRALLEHAVEGGIAPSRLLPGTGVADLTETVELTRHALSMGVTTVVMLPPFYYKQVTDEGLFASYAAVVDRVADPRLRVVLYHIPMFSAVPIPIPVIARLREVLGRVRRAEGLVGRPRDRSWAAEVAHRGITVNVVAPGATETPMLHDPARGSVAPRLPPIGRFVQPQEVAALVAFLLGEEAAAITGQQVVICGGASL